MFQATGSNNSGLLLELADLLEQGKPIPSELAKPCSELIRDAVLRGGKLDLGKQAGRPTAHEERVERALAVGHLMGTERISEAKAKTKLAEKHGVSRKTIDQACKRWPKIVEIGRRIVVQMPKWHQQSDEFRTLLHTFLNDDGTKFTEEDVAEIFDILPSPLLSRVSTRITNSLRRDRKVLNEILVSEGILFDE